MIALISRQTIISLLSLIQFTEGWLGTVVVPLLPLMVQQFPADPTLSEEENRYSNNLKIGLIGSCYFFAAMAAAVVWGWLSDRFGRRPTLLFGISGSALGILMFGCTRDFGSALFAYTFTGAFSSNISITKSYLAEVSSERNQPEAFASVCLMYGLAELIAPIAGGSLAGIRRVDVLSITNLPYAFVVSAVSCLLVLTTLAICVKWLPESPAFLGHQASSSKCVEMAVLPAQDDARADMVKPARLDFQCISVLTPMIVNYGILALIEIALQELLAIFCESSIASGGLSLSSQDVGSVFAAEGISLIIYQGVIYRCIARHISVISCFQYSCFSLILLVPLPWFGRLFTAHHPLMWFLFTSLSLRTIPEATAYISVHILIANASPPHMRGLVNGLASAAASAGRAVAPLLTSVLWASSSSKSMGWIPFVILSNFAAMLAILSLQLGRAGPGPKSSLHNDLVRENEDEENATEPLVSIKL